MVNGMPAIVFVTPRARKLWQQRFAEDGGGTSHLPNPEHLYLNP